MDYLNILLTIVSIIFYFSCIFSLAYGNSVGVELSLSICLIFLSGWSNPKSQIYYAEEENQGKECQGPSIADSSIITSFVDPQTQSQSGPKLEDFLGDSSSMVRYPDSQTETQDSSSLTQIYDQGSAYFGDQQQDLKAITGFQAFSTNSGSEVDDSASIARTQLACGEFTGHSIDSSGNELGFSSCPTGSLSLGVTQSPEKAIVSADSDSTKKVADTFGQRTSIYRGVTRYFSSIILLCYNTVP